MTKKTMVKLILVSTSVFLLILFFSISPSKIVKACTDYDQEVDYTFYNEYNQYPYSWATFYMCSGSLQNRNETHWVVLNPPDSYSIQDFSGYSYNNYTPYTITNYNVVISRGWLEFRLDRVPCNVPPGSYLSVDSRVSGVWGTKGSSYVAIWETFTSNGTVQIIQNVIQPAW